MNGYQIDRFLIDILPRVFFAIGFFIYAIKLGNLKDFLKKLTPLLLYAGIEVAHKLFGFLNANPFLYFLMLFVIFFWCLILHCKNTGLVLFACGGISNAIVSLINGGRMPMHSLESVSGFYQPMTENTIFPFLCDWILSPFHNYFISFGDILLAVGIVIFLIQELIGLWKNFRKDKKI